MDPRLAKLLKTNAQWAAAHQHENPIYFDQLKAGQKPHALLLGCSDSRVSPSVVMGADLGELFIHRNIANVVAHADLNFLSVLQYAVEVLGVREIIVYGHYGCGGIKAAMDDEAYGLIDNWLANIKDVMELNAVELAAITDPQARHDRLVELNVLAQIKNLQQTSVIRKAINKGIAIHLHGWIYDFSTGHIKVVYEAANDPVPQ